MDEPSEEDVDGPGKEKGMNELVQMWMNQVKEMMTEGKVSCI